MNNLIFRHVTYLMYGILFGMLDQILYVKLLALVIIVVSVFGIVYEQGKLTARNEKEVV